MNPNDPTQKREWSPTRRSVLATTGSVLTVSAIAGCTDEDDGGENGDGEAEPEDDMEDAGGEGDDADEMEDMDGDEDEDAEDDEMEDEDENDDAQALLDDDEEPDYDGWFDETPNYEGTVDLRGEDNPIVVVGSGDDGFEYEPPAIVVDPGVTVGWEWTGEGGAHDVSEENGEFESDLLEDDGEEFEQEFTDDDEGIVRYICTPHEVQGMVGAVVVGEPADAEGE